jgi:hypothetical protein
MQLTQRTNPGAGRTATGALERHHGRRLYPQYRPLPPYGQRLARFARLPRHQAWGNGQRFVIFGLSAWEMAECWKGCPMPRLLTVCPLEEPPERFDWSCLRDPAGNPVMIWRSEMNPLDRRPSLEPLFNRLVQALFRDGVEQVVDFPCGSLLERGCHGRQ